MTASGAEPLTLSVIIPVRNRAGERLANCLRSLRWQELGPRDSMELIISDFGSSPDYARQIAELAARFEVRVVTTATDEVWNRSRALNMGIQVARGDYVFCTDADMIFAPDFVRRGLEAQTTRGGNAFVICRCRDLPERVPEQAWAREDFPSLLAAAPFREKLGTGACQFARRSFFESIRGYDEGYVFWGMEDNDMLFRARQSGLAPTWIHDLTSMLHQWHPSSRNTRPLRKTLNDLRFHLTKRVRVKNWRGWGKRPAIWAGRREGLGAKVEAPTP